MKTFALCLATVLAATACSHNKATSSNLARTPSGSETYACTMTDSDAAPSLTFLIRKAAGDEQAALLYKSSDSSRAKAITGCEADAVSSTKLTDDALYVECAGDGDAGFLSATRDDGADTYTGTVNFPNGGIEGYDEAELAVSCAKQ